jgi:hypothetical protein
MSRNLVVNVIDGDSIERKHISVLQVYSLMPAVLTRCPLGHLQVPGCVRLRLPTTPHSYPLSRREANPAFSVQVNIPAETGEMGVLANHVPSIEQLKPGLVEVIEESGGNKQFFRMYWHFQCESEIAGFAIEGFDIFQNACVGTQELVPGYLKANC